MLQVVVANLQLVDFRKFHNPEAAILLIGVGESEFFLEGFPIFFCIFNLKSVKTVSRMSYGRPPPRIEGMVSLKVDNLTYRTTPDDLRRVFERCGEVGDIYIPRDRFSRESRGFAFVR